jgi:hypothetical protein
MRSLNIKKLIAVSALGLFAILGTSEFANAQDNRNDQNQQHNKHQEKSDKARAKAEQQRIQAEQKHQAELNRQNARQNSNRWKHDGYNNGQWNTGVTHYRVSRNGSYYNTDNRGADLLRQAVNSGYQQGYAAGQSDQSGRRRSSYSTSSGYRSGNYGYENYVDQSQYQYYFRQGFQRGYQDGYSSRNQYGNGGSILGTILGSILNVQTF